MHKERFKGNFWDKITLVWYNDITVSCYIYICTRIRAPISSYISSASACLALHLAVRPAHARSETPETRDAHRIPNIRAGDSSLCVVRESKDTQTVHVRARIWWNDGASARASRVNATVKPRKSLGVNFIARSTSRRWYERGEELGENALRQFELWLALPPDMSAELAMFLRAQAEKLYIQHPRISVCKCCQDSRSNFRASN